MKGVQWDVGETSGSHKNETFDRDENPSNCATTVSDDAAEVPERISTAARILRN